MKLKYEKPRIEVEEFQLDAAVASCNQTTPWINLNYSEETCSLDLGGGASIFSSACPGGQAPPSDEICYNGVTGGMSIFAS